MHYINIINELKKRGFIAQCTDELELLKIVEKSSIALYCGFDITADSLHLGHLLPLLCLKHFQKKGHQPIVLLGGATSLIGDPSFKKNERNLINIETIFTWEKKIRKQILLFLDFNNTINSAKIINNYDWFSKINMISFLRDIGKNFSVNQMINREAVKNRINFSDTGISFTEFSYNLLQAYDFATLHKKYRVMLQIGGSDQWGNIVSGITLTRRLFQSTVFGLTIPLLVQKNGIKFGKTETGTIWLDADKTSPYKFYQFWINQSDCKILNFLYLFTDLSCFEIEKINSKNQNCYNVARKILAEKITSLVHGVDGLSAAKRITNFLFSGLIKDMMYSDFLQLKKDGIPYVKLSGSEDLQKALVDSNLASSRGHARNMVLSKAIYVNNNLVTNEKFFFKDIDKIFGAFTLLRRGKKHYCLLCWNDV